VQLEEVAVHAFGHDQLGGMGGERPGRLEQVVAHLLLAAGQLVADDAEALVALHHRHPQQPAVAAPLRAQGGERPPGQRPLHRHRLALRPARPGQRRQDPLLVVDEEDRRVEGAEPPGVLGQQAGHGVGHGEPGLGQQVAPRFGGGVRVH